MGYLIRSSISIVLLLFTSLLLIFHGVAATELTPHKPQEGDFPQRAGGGKSTEESIVVNNGVEGKPRIPKGGIEASSIEASMVNVHQGKDFPKGRFEDVKYPSGGYPEHGYGGYPQRAGYYRGGYPQPGGYHGGYPRRGGGGYYVGGYPRRDRYPRHGRYQRRGGYYRGGPPRRGYPGYGRHCRFNGC